MNIWLFNHYGVPPFLFPHARPYYFAKNLIKEGNEVTIFAASAVHNSDINVINDKIKYKTEVIDDINYVYLKTRQYKGNGLDRIINMCQYAQKLLTVSKKFKRPDIIIASSVHPLTCVAGILIAKRYKIKCIVEIADLWPLTLVELGRLDEKSIITKLLYRLEHWIYKKADSIIFTMEGGKDYIKDMGWQKDVDLNKIYYINNGIDLEVFDYNKINEQYDDIDLDRNEDFKVIYTGSIGKANAVEYIVDAAKIILDKGYEKIKFIIFGDGYKRNELEKFCKDNNISNVVFKGKVDKKYIPNILSKGDMTIFTGENTNLGKYGLSLNKMFDYLAAGKPILSNINCGYDIIKNHSCGKTVNANNSHLIAEGIIEFYLMKNDEYNNFCKNSRNVAYDFDFSKLTLKLEKVINNTIYNIYD